MRHSVGGSRNVEVNNGESEDVEAIRRGIVRHLRHHPLARDTVEGIRAWWLAPAGVIAMEIVVEAVVERMARDGELQCLQLPDGQRLYGRARSQE